MTPTFSIAVMHSPERDRQWHWKTYVEPTVLQCPQRFLEERRAPDGLRSIMLGDTTWRESLKFGVTHHVFLDDDVFVAPKFWAILSAMVTAHPREILGIHTVSPRAANAAGRDVRWLLTCAWLVGVCYVMPHEDLSEFIAWRELRSLGLLRRTPCDSLVNSWASETGRDIWHPVPTIVQHLDSNPRQRSRHTWVDEQRRLGGTLDLLRLMQEPTYWQGHYELAPTSYEGAKDDERPWAGPYEASA